MISRRPFLFLPLLAGLPAARAFAQDAATRPIRFVVPTAPGTATDTIARYMANGLAKAWGTTVIVENKLGAGGVIGTEFVARSPADGTTILFTYSSHYSNQWVLKTSFDAVSDFEPIARLASSALIVVTGAQSRLQTVRDVIVASQGKPGSLTYGSAGNGTTSHMAAALMSSIADVNLVHVPYKAPGEAAVAAAGGLIDLAFGGLATYAPLIRAGRLRGLAVTTSRRSGILPDVPTLAEAGVPGYEISSSTWALAPRGTPQALVNRMSETFVRLASTAEFKEACLAVGNDVDIHDAATFKADAPRQLEKWKRLSALTKDRA